MSEASISEIPAHQWTNGGSRVLVVKCAELGGKSHNGFTYPRSGKVKPEVCSREPNCESGGLFGWPWGIGFGDGKEPNYSGDWFVLSAPPEQVVAVGDGGKCKVAADDPEAVDCEVVYAGDALGAIMFTHAGRLAWICRTARGNAAASGARGNAAASGWSGNAAASGERGNAAASGERGNAAASGESGSAAASGERGVAALSGECGTVCGHSTGIAVTTADKCTWVVVEGCVFLQRWQDGHRCITAQDIGAKTGDRVRFVMGEIVEHIRREP